MALTTQAAEPIDNAATGAPPAARRRLGLPPMTGKLAAGLILGGAILLFGLVGPFLVQNPSEVHDLGLAGPSGAHLLGTTQTGQDVLAQLTYATRGSLTVGAIVGVLTLLLSAFFGVVGAYAGGWLD